jgi:hypothetical protein
MLRNDKILENIKRERCDKILDHDLTWKGQVVTSTEVSPTPLPKGSENTNSFWMF